MADLKEWESTSGQTDSSTKESGLTASNMALVCGEEPRETATWVNGRWEKPRDTECTSGPTATAMRVSSVSASSTVKELNDSRMEICTKVSMSKESQVDTEIITGPMVRTSKATSKTDSEKDTACGKRPQGTATSTKVSTTRTRNMDMASFHGLQEMSTKATIAKISETGTERCFGAMEATIRDSGLGEYNMEKECFMCLGKDLRKANSKTTFW